MELTYIDYPITKVEKTNQIEEVSHYTDVYVNGIYSSSTNYYKSYENNIKTIVYFAQTRIVHNVDLPVKEGWTVRIIYENDKKIYYIIRENNLILWQKDTKKFNSLFASRISTPELENLLSFNTNNDYTSIVYNTKYMDDFVIGHENKIVLSTEKIPKLQKDGYSYNSTRIYYLDNSSDIFEKEIAIQPGWTVHKIYFGFRNIGNYLRKSIILETREQLFCDLYYEKSIKTAIARLIKDYIKSEHEYKHETPRKVGLVALLISGILLLITRNAVYDLTLEHFYQIDFERINIFFNHLFTGTGNSNDGRILFFLPSFFIFSITIFLFLDDLLKKIFQPTIKVIKWFRKNSGVFKDILKDWEEKFYL
jgi:hypothetical protein